MQDRIGFKDDATREKFFSSVREASGANSWKALWTLVGVPRTSFQDYKCGNLFLPGGTFESMLKFLPADKREFFINQTTAMLANWGAVKGGKENFEKNKSEILSRLKKVCHIGGLHSRGNSREMNLNMPLSIELCEFIGAFMGDGCIDSHIDKRGKSHYHISITGNAELDSDYLTKVIPSFVATIIDANPRLYPRSDCKAIILNFHSKALFKLLTERFQFPIGKKTLIVKIPDEIFSSDERLVFAAVRGIFDTDGCVFLDKRKIYLKPYPRITLQITSEPLFLQLKKFLTNYFSLYTYRSDKRGSYYLEVYGHRQLAKWMQLIGFSNKRHLNKVEQLNEEP